MQLVLILEYAPGVELFDAILSKTSFSEDEARPVFVQVRYPRVRNTNGRSSQLCCLHLPAASRCQGHCGSCEGSGSSSFAIEIIKTSVSITRDASRAASIFQSADLLRVKFVLLKGNNRSVSVRRAEWKMSV